MAKAWQLKGSGIDALTLADTRTPPLGPDQVRISVRACALNYRDYATVLNPVGRLRQLPFIPGSDAAGEVIEVGADVTALRPGDRVATCFFQNWTDGPCSSEAMASALGGALPGVMREELVLGQQGVVRVPDHLGLLDAACLPCAAVTAWHALVHVGEVQAGNTVLLLGTGGVSIFALQFAELLGAEVIITSSSDEKLERARGLGATHTINYRTEPDWAARVLELTEGRGADLTVEVGGGGTLPTSIEATRVAGRIALVGILSQGAFDPTPIMRKSLRLQGVFVGSKAMFMDMNRTIAEHRLMPIIDRTFAFEDLPDAFQAMAAAEHVGKLVILR